MPVIRISDATWEQLKQWAVPLEDSAENAMSRALEVANHYSDLATWLALKAEQAPKKEETRTNKARDPKKLPQRELEWPLLETLYELGGSAEKHKVLEAMEPKVKDRLYPADYETVSSGEARWCNATAWARYELRKRGLIRDDSQYGVWVLSEEGMRYVRSAKSGG